MTEKITDSNQIRKKAMDLLATREHSRLELSRKLKQRYLDVHLINSVIDLLIEENLQSDERFTEAYLRSRIEKGKGPNIIFSELLQKGIDESLASSILGTISEEEWCKLASSVMNKKLGYNKELDYHKQLKLMKFLTYRGFTRDQIEKAKYLLSDNNSTDINEDK